MPRSQSTARGVRQPPSQTGPSGVRSAPPPETAEHCHSSSTSTHRPGEQVGRAFHACGSIRRELSRSLENTASISPARSALTTTGFSSSLCTKSWWTKAGAMTRTPTPRFAAAESASRNSGLGAKYAQPRAPDGLRPARRRARAGMPRRRAPRIGRAPSSETLGLRRRRHRRPLRLARPAAGEAEKQARREHDPRRSDFVHEILLASRDAAASPRRQAARRACPPG